VVQAEAQFLPPSWAHHLHKGARSTHYDLYRQFESFVFCWW